MFQTKIMLNVACICLLCVGCGADLDTRRPILPATFGQTVYQEIDHRFAAGGSDEQLLVLRQHRSRLIQALDTVVDDDLQNDLHDFLLAMLPTYDNGMMRAQINALQEVLKNLQITPAAIEALLHHASTENQDFVRMLVTYPQWPDILDDMARMLDDTRVQEALQHVQTTHHRLLQQATSVPRLPTLKIMADYLLSPDEKPKLQAWMQQLSMLARNNPAALLDSVSLLRAFITTTNVYASPLDDTVDITTWLLQQPALLQSFELFATLINQYPDIIQTWIDLFKQIDTWLQIVPNDHQLLLKSKFFDDLTALMIQIVREPGLLEDIFDAVKEPEVARLATLVAQHMRFKDTFNFNPIDVNGPVLGQFSQSVDRRVADTVKNRSLWQRVLHLIHDSRTPICNKKFAEYNTCELVHIHDGALFYMQSILGSASMTLRFFERDALSNMMVQQFSTFGEHGESGIETMTGINGFSFIDTTDVICNPVGTTLDNQRICASFLVSPEAAGRLLFAPFDPRLPSDSYIANSIVKELFDELKVKHIPFHVLHGGTLFVWENDHFFDAVKPLMQAFFKHEREDLFIGMLDMLHLHWASTDSETTQRMYAEDSDFSYQSGLVYYEDVFANMLDQGHLISHMANFLKTIETITLADGTSGTKALVALIRQIVLPDENPYLYYHHGAEALFTPDQQQRIVDIAPIHILRSIGIAISDNMQQQQYTPLSWHDIDQHTLLPLVAQTFTDLHTQTVDLDAFAEDIKSIMQNPAVIATIELWNTLLQDALLHAHMADLLTYVLSDHTQITYETSVSLLHREGLLGDTLAILQGMLPMFKQDTGLISTSLNLFKFLQERDTKHAGPRLLAALMRDVNGQTAASHLVDIWVAINRQDPLQHPQPLMTQDYTASILPGVIDFLSNDQHGMLRLLDLLEARHGDNL